MIKSLVLPTQCPNIAAAIAAKQNKRFIRSILSKRSYMIL